MRVATLLLLAFALQSCGESADKLVYDMTLPMVRQRLFSAHYGVGAIPTMPEHDVHFNRVSETVTEWFITKEGTGSWCDVKLIKISKTRTKIDVDCPDTQFGLLDDQPELEELISSKMDMRDFDINFSKNI